MSYVPLGCLLCPGLGAGDVGLTYTDLIEMQQRSQEGFAQVEAARLGAEAAATRAQQAAAVSAAAQVEAAETGSPPPAETAFQPLPVVRGGRRGRRWARPFRRAVRRWREARGMEGMSALEDRDPASTASFFYGVGVMGFLCGIGVGSKGGGNTLAFLVGAGSLLYANSLRPTVDMQLLPAAQDGIDRARQQWIPGSRQQVRVGDGRGPGGASFQLAL